ncbi:DUF362 domain-containing protein [candidate division KSB1 bacterium]
MSVFTKKGKELVSKVKAGSDLKKSINKSVRLIGGFSKFVKKGDTIVVKPNFNTDDEFPGSSDPNFVKAVIDLLYNAGAKKVILAESSWFRGDTKKYLESTGMMFKARKARADVVVLNDGKWIPMTVVGKHMKRFHVAEVYTKYDKIVFLPCMKTHRHARFTLSLKLPMGLIRADDRVKMHMMGLQKKIADMNLAVTPGLVIMDARKCFITRGPETGDVREPGLIMASGDRVAIDVEAVKIIQSYEGNDLADTPVWEFDQIKWSIENEIGVSSEKEYDVVEK